MLLPDIGDEDGDKIPANLRKEFEWGMVSRNLKDRALIIRVGPNISLIAAQIFSAKSAERAHSPHTARTIVP